MPDHGKIVGDEQIGQPPLPLQTDEQVDDLSLNGNIQRGDRLIAYDKFRIHRQSPGNAYPLPLPAGKLMGKAAGELLRQSHG